MTVDGSKLIPLEGDRPDSDVRAVAPDWRMAKLIRVESDFNGAPVVYIDGEPLPWYTAGVIVPAPSRSEAPTVTVTFLAERVELVNRGPRPRWREDDTPI